jgi:hypothetical protein
MKSMKIMRFSKIFLAAIIALGTTIGCAPNIEGGGNVDTTKWENEGTLVGEWELTSWSGNNNAKPLIYLILNEDSSFDMYQKVYTSNWTHYDGNYSVSEENILSGTYSDGEKWYGDYAIQYAENPRRIRLTNVKEENEVLIYTESVVPTSVLEEAKGASQPEPVRSSIIKRFL